MLGSDVPLQMTAKKRTQRALPALVFAIGAGVRCRYRRRCKLDTA